MHTRWLVPVASTTPRLVASVVLPQPPLAANTVTIWPWRPVSGAVGASVTMRRDTS